MGMMLQGPTGWGAERTYGHCAFPLVQLYRPQKVKNVNCERVYEGKSRKNFSVEVVEGYTDRS